MKWSNEAKVGLLFVLTLVLGGSFAWIIGGSDPFEQTLDFYVTYDFAGGIEVGSPVRVSGIKVGKVEEIEFFLEPTEGPIAQQNLGSAVVTASDEFIPVRLKLSVSQAAARGIRQDSKFYINLAGIIGERYIEVTPGSRAQPEVKSGDILAGVNPPRIDQLISQSFGLAQKIIQVIEDNEGEIGKTLELAYKLSKSFHKTVVAIEKSKLFESDLAELVDHLAEVTRSVRHLTERIETPEGQKTLELMHSLLWRLEPLQAEKIRQFLQDEGIRARIF